MPPSRASVFTSAVNLKILQKAAEKYTKKLVLVTKQPTIIALAGGLSLYVAETLNTPPSVPASGASGATSVPSTVIEGAGVLGPTEVPESPESPSTATELGENTANPQKSSAFTEDKKHSRIPNFNAFKKKLFLIIAGLLLIVAGLVWAIVFAPRAEIVITARTQELPVEVSVDLLRGSTEPDADASTPQLKALERSTEKTVSQPVTATGEKNIGTKATGTMTVVNCEQSSPVTFKKGTTFKKNSAVFTADESFVVPGSNFSGGGSVCEQDGSASVSVTALEPGDSQNVAAQSYSIQNISGDYRASGGNMSGGTNKIVPIITQADIDRAVGELNTEASTAVIGELTALFPDGTQIIDESLEQKVGSAKPNPAAGTEAASGVVEVTATYNIFGVARSELASLIDAQQTTLIDENQQAITTNGLDTAKITVTDKNSTKLSISVAAIGSTGPVISPDLIEKLTGLRFSEAEKIVSEIPGTVETDIRTSPFWVYNMPNRSSSITVTVKQLE